MYNKMKSSFVCKRFMKSIALPVLFAAAALSLNGCLLDAFDTLTQELPLSVDVSLASPLTSFEQSTTVDLNESDFYNENKDKINKIELVKIAYKTKSVSPSSLTGTITLTVKQNNGTVLFSKVIAGNMPSNYLTQPYELSLTQSEIQLVNAYLSILTNRTFTATVKVETTTVGTKTLEAEIFAVFEMDYDL